GGGWGVGERGGGGAGGRGGGGGGPVQRWGGATGRRASGYRGGPGAIARAVHDASGRGLAGSCRWGPDHRLLHAGGRARRTIEPLGRRPPGVERTRAGSLPGCFGRWRGALPYDEFGRENYSWSSLDRTSTLDRTNQPLCREAPLFFVRLRNACQRWNRELCGGAVVEPDRG